MMNKTFLVLSLLSVQTIAFAARPVRGVYTVPMTSGPDGTTAGGKNTANRFEVKFKSDSYGTFPVTLKFPLPAGLLGSETWVTFNRVPDVASRYAGPNGSGTCRLLDDILECTFQFEKISPDMTAVENYWKDQAVSQDMLNARLAVAEKFGGEPIGILKYWLSEKDEHTPPPPVNWPPVGVTPTPPPGR
ncbi:hypothetical protein EBR21_11020 [bacterium]|nr:hypothetical protein [bacterium]